MSHKYLPLFDSVQNWHNPSHPLRVMKCQVLEQVSQQFKISGDDRIFLIINCRFFNQSDATFRILEQVVQEISHACS